MSAVRLFGGDLVYERDAEVYVAAEEPWTHEELAQVLSELVIDGQLCTRARRNSTVFARPMGSFGGRMQTELQIRQAFELLRRQCEAPDDTEFLHGAVQALAWALGEHPRRFIATLALSERTQSERQVEP